MASFAQFAVRAAQAPAALKAARREAVKAGALVVTTAVRREIASASGGDSKMSGIGRSGSKVGAGFEMVGDDTALVKARGAGMAILEGGARPHVIRPKARSRSHVLAIPGIGVRAYVLRHPGMKGKEPWAKGVDGSAAEAQRAMAREVVRGLGKVFGG